MGNLLSIFGYVNVSHDCLEFKPQETFDKNKNK